MALKRAFPYRNIALYNIRRKFTEISNCSGFFHTKSLPPGRKNQFGWHLQPVSRRESPVAQEERPVHRSRKPVPLENQPAIRNEKPVEQIPRSREKLRLPEKAANAATVEISIYARLRRRFHLLYSYIPARFHFDSRCWE